MLPPDPIDPAAARGWSIRLPTGPAARWILLVMVLLDASVWLAFRQQPRPDSLQPVRLFSWNWWRYPIQHNAFVEPVIRSDIATVFPMLDGQTVWAGGTGGLLIVSRDAGRTWDTAAVYGPANWDAIKAARGRAATTLSADTLQGDTVGADTPAAAFLDIPLGRTGAQLQVAVRTATPVHQRGSTLRPAPALTALLQVVGKLAGPAPLYAQGSTTTPGQTIAPGQTVADGAQAPRGSRRIRLVGEVRDIFFLDPRLGWAVTSWGDVLITRDGGTRWDLNPSAVGEIDEQTGSSRYRAGPLELSALGTLGFADSLRGMVTTRRGMMYTTDGGQTWSTSIPVSQGYYHGRLVQGAVGYAVRSDGSHLVRTRDAGATWSSVRTPQAYVPPRAYSMPANGVGVGAYFRDARTGWMAFPRGNRTVLWGTRDGGTSWQMLSDSLPRMRIDMLRPGGPLLGRIFEADPIILRSESGTSWDTVRVPVNAQDLRFMVANLRGRMWGAGREGIIFSSDSVRSWRVLTGSTSLRAISFTDGSRGYAVGRAGMVLATRDGGKRWLRERSGTSADLLSVAFSAPGEAWAVGMDGVAIRTRDGRTWFRATLPGVSASDRLTRVQFADTLHGWISGDSTLLRTQNGGISWQRLDAPKSLSSVEFTSATNGWATAGDGLLHTRDGGVTWNAVPNSGMGDRPYTVQTTFVNDSVGWRTGGTVVHATRDGGRTWIPQPLGDSTEVYQVRFLDERTGFAVGTNGAVYATVDGGAQWRRESAPTTRDLYDVAVVEGRAWAVGEGGVIIRRDPAGQWHALRATTAPAPWLYLICTVLAMSVLVAARRSAERERTAAARNAASVEAMLISDRPLQPGDPDPFELNTLALGISKFLRNPRTRPPLTLAITGKWGTGKSSLMNLVRRDLEANRFRPVWFNAWHHQKEEHLLAALLESIRAQAVPRWLSPAGVVFRMRLFWVRVKRHRPSALLVCIVAALFLGYLAGDADRVSSLWTSLSRTALDPVGAGRGFLHRLAVDFSSTGGSVAAYLTLLTAGVGAAAWRAFRAFGVKPAALMASVAGRVRLRDLQQQAGFRHQFAREFSEVTEALHPMDMVLFVDDLDRCRPEQVLEVLESINFLVSSGDCVVVMGMDPQWVIRCVGLAFDQIAQETAAASANGAGDDADGQDDEAQRRSNRDDFARHYLEKLVNIEIPVPVPTPLQMRGLVQSSGAERRAKPTAPRTLRTTGLRFLRHPATARYATYAAVALGVFALSFTAFRPRMEVQTVADAFVPASPAPAAGPATTADTDTAAGAAEPTAGTVAQPVPPERPGVLVGAPPAERALGVPALAGLALLLAVGIGLLQRRDALVQDSRTFTTALAAWSGVIASQGFTPRTTKKFLNRLRYYAMRQRALEPAQSPAGRLSQALRRFWAALWAPEPAAPPADQAESTPVISLEERRASAQGSIPEPVLVALACLHECHPTGIPQAAYNDFHGFVRINPLTAEFSEEILSPELAYPPSLAGYRKRFEEISEGVRIR